MQKKEEKKKKKKPAQTVNIQLVQILLVFFKYLFRDKLS